MGLFSSLPTMNSHHLATISFDEFVQGVPEGNKGALSTAFRTARDAYNLACKQERPFFELFHDLVLLHIAPSNLREWLMHKLCTGHFSDTVTSFDVVSSILSPQTSNDYETFRKRDKEKGDYDHWEVKYDVIEWSGFLKANKGLSSKELIDKVTRYLDGICVSPREKKADLRSLLYRYVTGYNKWMKDIEFFQWAMNNGCNIRNIKDCDDESLLLILLKRIVGIYEDDNNELPVEDLCNVISALIDKGWVDVNAPNDIDECPIHYLSSAPSLLPLLEKVLKDGLCDIEAKSRQGAYSYTPLFYAVHHNNLDGFKVLENYGADINARTCYSTGDRYMIGHEIRHDDWRSVFTDPLRHDSGNTILHEAYNGGTDTPLFRYIIEKYPHLVSEVNHSGLTPLELREYIDKMYPELAEQTTITVMLERHSDRVKQQKKQEEQDRNVSMEDRVLYYKSRYSRQREKIQSYLKEHSRNNQIDAKREEMWNRYLSDL